MKKKVLLVHFSHETNSFCPSLADEAAYRNMRFEVGEETFEKQRGIATGTGAFLEVFEKYDDIELIPTVALSASPSGPVTADVYDFVVQELTRVINEQAPFDGVILNCHGAMVAHGHDDGEGDLFEIIRNLVGRDIPLIASLDLHANVTAKMARCATALVPYECYPHTDTYDTGIAAARLMVDTLSGKINPVMAYRRIPFLLPLLPSASHQMQPLYDLAKEQNNRPGALCVRFTHGFFPADIEEMGMAVMAIADGDEVLAESLADELAAEIEKNIPKLKPEYISLDEALDKALTPGDGPVVLADASDNPGAGGLCDTTHILRRILERGITGAAVATIVDPDSVEKCIKAGVGSVLRLSLGGWSDHAYSGGPIETDAYVKMITDGKYIAKCAMSRGDTFKHGKTAVVEIAGNLVLIASVPRQAYDLEIFRSHGICPEDQRILVTKSAIHYRDSYGEVARDMIALSLPGYSVPVPEGYEYKKWKQQG